MAQSGKRVSVLADGTTVDQEYYQSKHYILSQLEQRRDDGSVADTDKPKSAKANVDSATNAMLKSGAISEDDGWLLASMELTIRNPFCIANHPAQDQQKFYQKVLMISSIFMFMVAFATLMWTWWWGIIIKGGTKPIMPCRGDGTTLESSGSATTLLATSTLSWVTMDVTKVLLCPSASRTPASIVSMMTSVIAGILLRL